MGPTDKSDQERWTRWMIVAHVIPFVVFMAMIEVPKIWRIENDDLPWYRHSPEQWVYPVQTILVLTLLLVFWKYYRFKPYKGIGLGLVLGTIGIAFWLLPEWLYHRWGVADWSKGPRINIPFVLDTEEDGNWQLLGLAKRDEGFDPTFIKEAGNYLLYWGAVVFRFLRMVVVVALVEEIFWRGFLQRWLINPDKPFWKTKFGTHSWKAYFLTTIFFTLVHHPVDYLACLIFGSLVYWISVRTKSLAACVAAHAIANLLLGLYTMWTGKFGFW